VACAAAVAAAAPDTAAQRLDEFIDLAGSRSDTDARQADSGRRPCTPPPPPLVLYLHDAPIARSSQTLSLLISPLSTTQQIHLTSYTLANFSVGQTIAKVDDVTSSSGSLISEEMAHPHLSVTFN